MRRSPVSSCLERRHVGLLLKAASPRPNRTIACPAHGRRFGLTIVALLCFSPLLVSLAAGQETTPPLTGSPSAPVSGRRGPGEPLPPLAPSPAPSAPVTVPVPAPAAPLEGAPSFVLREIRVDGNTVLDPAAIDAVIAPYRGKRVTISDLEEVRRRLTVLYIEHGYINSGVLIPAQDVGAGVVVFRAVEGRVTDIEVTGTEHFDPEYFRTRLARGLDTPFNVRDAEAEQQILLQDPLVRRLNIDLLPGLTPGEARMQADVLESSRLGLSAQLANDQSPTVGEVRGHLHGTVANLLGVGDVLAMQYGRSDGLDDGFVGYSVPISSDDTTLNFRYDRNGTLVVDPKLAPLNITSVYSGVTLGISRPFYRTPSQALVLGAQLERRAAQSFLLGTPFPFTQGADANGKTNVTVLRLYQSWLDRDADDAVVLRSTFNLGLHALGSTVASSAPGAASSDFFSWLGQAQYVHRVFDDWEAVIRSDIQLSHDPLFPIEQFALGGIDTVRGYRQYLSVTDSAFFASGEMHIPVAKLSLTGDDEAGQLQLVPFYDFGRGWNVATPTPAPAEISSAGLGLRWQPAPGVLAELYYGKAFTAVHLGTSLQDRGIHFRIVANLY